MPHLPGRIWLLPLVTFVLACAHAQVIPPERMIRMQLIGDSLAIEDEVDVNWRQPVRWESADPDAVWVVVFADSTPFRGGNPRRVFNGGGPGNSANGGPLPSAPPDAADALEYEYWVFYPDGAGGYLTFDPKLVIRK
jgi:hypothetical protein